MSIECSAKTPITGIRPPETFIRPSLIIPPVTLEVVFPAQDELDTVRLAQRPAVIAGSGFLWGVVCSAPVETGRVILIGKDSSSLQGNLETTGNKGRQRLKGSRGRSSWSHGSGRSRRWCYRCGREKHPAFGIGISFNNDCKAGSGLASLSRSALTLGGRSGQSRVSKSPVF